MSTLSNKDKREVISDIAENILLSGDMPRLATDLFWSGRDTTWVIDQYQLPVWMKAFAHFNDRSRFYTDDIKHVRKVIAALANTAELPELERRSRLSFDSPVELTGMFEPRVSRRADLTPAEVTISAMKAMGKFPMVVHEPTRDILLKWKAQLPEEEQARYIPTRLEMEWGIVGANTVFGLYNGADEQSRIYGNSSGTFLPMYDPASRATIRHAESKPLTKADMQRFSDWLQTEFKLDMATEAWVDGVLRDPVTYLNRTRDRMAIGAAFAWYEAVQTGRSNYIMYVDAPASGLGHIYATVGDSRTEMMVNMAHKSYTHPHTLLAEAMRNADVHNLRNAPLKDIVKQLAKPTTNPGMYGGGHRAIASTISGLEHDGKNWVVGSDEDPKFPELPSLLEREFRGVDDPQEVMGILERICKPYARTLRQLFPPIVSLNKATRSEWQASMEATGLPAPIVDRFGYVNQPTPFSRNTVARPLDVVRASWRNVEGNRSQNNYPAFKLDIADQGTQGLAKRIHQSDAKTMAFAADDLHARGIDSKWIHDCGGTHITDIPELLDSYRRGFEETHGIKLPADAVMLR